MTQPSWQKVKRNERALWWKGFPCGSANKEFTCNARDLGLIPELGRSPGERKGYPLQYSGLENSMDCIVYEVAKSWTRLSNLCSHQWWLMKVKEERAKSGLKVNIPKTKIMASGPITLCKQMGKQWKQWLTFYFWAPKSLQMVTAAMQLKATCSFEEKLWQT